MAAAADQVARVRMLDLRRKSFMEIGGTSRQQDIWACVRRRIETTGCSGMVNAPTAQSVAGLSPTGNVTVTEDFVTGVGGGSGTLELQGRTNPFKVVGTVAGPGGGLEKISASGPVYKLVSVSDFAGRYTQSTGKAGFGSSASSDLWLENSTGVIMHLQGTSSGTMLTLGKDEIFIRMNQ